MISIVMAVIVLSVLTIWFLISTGEGGGVVTKSFCEAKLYAFCSKNPEGGDFFAAAPECKVYTDLEATKQKCDEILNKA